MKATTLPWLVGLLSLHAWASSPISQSALDASGVKAAFGPYGYLSIDPRTQTIRINLDWEGLKDASGGVLDDNCLNPDGDNPGLKYHIHMPWSNLDDKFYGFGADCFAVNTGGHYDPTLKCSEASAAAECADIRGKGDFSYDCSVDNKGACEVGDLSGRVGRYNPFDARGSAQAFMDEFLTKIYTHEQDFRGRAIVFHCGDADVSTDGMDRAFCAPLLDSTHLWDYHLGGRDWGNFTGWDICNQGDRQSPLSLSDQIIAKHAHDNLTYIIDYDDNVSGAVFQNDGHGIIMDGDFGEIDFQHGHYHTVQVQFHCPAEHIVDGYIYACEMQLIHRPRSALDAGTNFTAYEDITMMAIFMEETGSDNQILASWGWASLLQDNVKRYPIPVPVNLDTLIEPALRGMYSKDEELGEFYRYDGSLTTPPCSEHVKWFVVEDPIKIGTNQLQLFKQQFPDPANAREIQLLRTRRVYKNKILTPEDEGPRVLMVSIVAVSIGLLGLFVYCCWRQGKSMRSSKYDPIEGKNESTMSSRL